VPDLDEELVKPRFHIAPRLGDAVARQGLDPKALEAVLLTGGLKSSLVALDRIEEILVGADKLRRLDPSGDVVVVRVVQPPVADDGDAFVLAEMELQLGLL
jgi:hypothetical protein